MDLQYTLKHNKTLMAALNTATAPVQAASSFTVSASRTTDIAEICAGASAAKTMVKSAIKQPGDSPSNKY